MKTIHVTPGSTDWLAHRATCFNASDAPAMLGCSPYKTRQQLLAELHTGLQAEVDAGTQRRFDDGHRFEALARPLAEELIGDDLAPVVGSVDVPGLSRPLGASFDGLTLMGDTGFEHKSANDDLRYTWDEGNGYHLPKHYRVQMEQQLLVSGAERVLFMATKWTPSGEIVEERHCWYASDSTLRAEILAGWRQFDADLAAYVPAEPVERATAAPVEALPAVLVEMRGALTVHSNLDAFGQALRAFIDRIPAQPSTDQEFADTDAACKALKRAEEALEAEDARALNGMADVATVRRVMADLKELARATRLQREKLVKARKEELRREQVQRGRTALADHLQKLNQRLGGGYMPDVPADFGGCISGLKSIDSIRDRIDTELARAKIAANEIADRLQVNLQAIDAAGHPGLFPDRTALALKAVDDCAAAIASRLAAEQLRQDAERERIREQERAALEKRQREEAEAREAAERALVASIQAAANRIEGESVGYVEKAMIQFANVAREWEDDPRPAVAMAIAAGRQHLQAKLEAALARQQAQAAAPAQPPAAAPIASPAPVSQAPAVVPMAPRAAPATPPTLMLREINARLAPLSIDAAGLARLGFPHAATDKSARLYHEADFGRMCDLIVAHIRTVQHQRAAA